MFKLAQVYVHKIDKFALGEKNLTSLSIRYEITCRHAYENHASLAIEAASSYNNHLALRLLLGVPLSSLNPILTPDIP